MIRQLNVKSGILKLSLFATGLSGIVAEYVLSTLATYFLGNSVLQWTMIVSIMLFSMGLGSRISKYLTTNLLPKFVTIEFTLSILSSLVAVCTYLVASISIYTGVVIYTLSIIIGLLIGMEIPLVIRLNDEFEELRINVSSIMEKDYYGSLAGGIFFAFFGLPILGLTYTPFVLGAINFSVAIMLLSMLWKKLQPPIRRKLFGLATVIVFIWVTALVMAESIIHFGEEKRYKDRVIFSRQSQYQRIVLTQAKGDYWLYINGNQQLSTVDEVMYHEPLVLPVMSLSSYPRDVLVLGGGDGCAIREILKYKDVNEITLVDLDPMMTDLARTHPVLFELNKGALDHEKVNILNQDAYKYLEETDTFYDVIIVDLPDPKTIELSRLYSFEFYKMCNHQLRPNGLIVTQSGSPYFANRAFKCVQYSMEEAGFNCVPIHNQVITLGEWGWIIGSKSLESDNLKQSLRELTFDNISTRWINNEAMLLMTSFGKDITLDPEESVEINSIHNPVLFKYYMKGNWDLY
jgi:spermidine synthase